ncbi:hypothetical protein KFU94_13480 [Chloroflexi bacterium TSY]|nr:hypothetical protein [Chloroflexi bacterium TSY]
MKTLQINGGEVTIRLSPVQCFLLAKICHQAYTSIHVGDIDSWRTFATLFHACAIAGLAQQHMCPWDEVAFSEQLMNVDL